MSSSSFRTLLIPLISFSLAASGFAQETPPAAKPAAAPKVNFPSPSPASTLKQRVGLTDIEVVYSRPSAKGRTMLGGNNPYGEVWRTGANSATKITFSTPVKIGGTELPAGSYALYSIPDASEWTVIFNKVVGDWGAYAYKAENDALRVKAKAVKLSEPVETFTIDINDLRNESATLNLIWEKTRVPVKLEFNLVQDIVAQIDASMNSGGKISAGQYYSAAQFYYDNNLDIQKARTWINEATKEKPPFHMLHWKAKILARAGDKAGAIAAAQQSIAAAEGAAKAEYTRLNETLIASLK